MGNETELIRTEKLSHATVFPLLAISTCGEEGLKTIVGR